MTDAVAIGIQGIHHIRLTVTDVERSQEFYTKVLGFAVARQIPTGVLLRNGSIVLGLGPAFDAAASPPDDRFNENRVGLDHLSFGEIKDIGIAHVLAFRDPDNIQLELSVSRT